MTLLHGPVSTPESQKETPEQKRGALVKALLDDVMNGAKYGADETKTKEILKQSLLTEFGVDNDDLEAALADSNTVATKFAKGVNDTVGLIYGTAQNDSINNDMKKSILSGFVQNLQEYEYIQKNDGAQESANNSNEPVDDTKQNATEEVKQTGEDQQDQSLAGLEKQLQEEQAKNTMYKTMAPDIIRADLVKHPGRIKQYMSRKMRNRFVSRKARNPVDFVFALESGRKKAFVKNKITKAYPLCDKMIQKYTKIVEDNLKLDGNRAELFNAQVRLAQLKAIAPTLKDLAATKRDIPRSAKDYAKML